MCYVQNEWYDISCATLYYMNEQIRGGGEIRMGYEARVGGEQKCTQGSGREGVRLEDPDSDTENNIKVELNKMGRRGLN